MLDTKVIEIRDRATFVVAIATRLTNVSGRTSEQERYLLSRAGFGLTCDDQAGYVVLYLPHNTRGTYDPFDWCDRTFHNVHQHLLRHWPEIKSGDVVDVEYILGETASPKKSESGGRLDGTFVMESGGTLS